MFVAHPSVFAAYEWALGLPGLRSDFFSQVKGRVLHCALSLVGEPIMYPRLNELVRLMHQKNISTFLVRERSTWLAFRSLLVLLLALPVCLILVCA